MHNHEINKLLEGDLNQELEGKKISDNSVEKDFVDSYQKLIARSQTKVPDFNPFEKIEVVKKKRIATIKQLLPYAAIGLIVISSVFIFQNYQTQQTKSALSEQEVMEIHENTTMALLYFSKEFKACMTNFEDAKEMQQPANEIKQLKDFKIHTNNPLKKINFN